MTATIARPDGLHLCLADRVPGQPHAIAVVTQRVREAGPSHLAAAFLFTGAPDAGQEELAQALADLLCGGALTVIDVHGYTQPRHVNALQATLTHAVRREPCGVLLIDGIDKAHPDALALFLRIARGGVLSGAGDTILIATASVAPDRALLACPDSVRIVPFVPARATHHPSPQRQPKETSCWTSTNFSYPSALPRSAART